MDPARSAGEEPEAPIAPGTRSSYSNLGTLVLGSALATASGKPFVELVRDEVLERLLMAQTGFAHGPVP